MKAPAFRYARPESLDEALSLLREYGSDARILAGGQTLMPMLNLRLLQPSVLLDINRIGGLNEMTLQDKTMQIGATARHAAVLYSEEVARNVPLLALALPHVAHMAVRNRGTHGGSCALADPSAEIPACALALDATFVVRGAAGERRVAAGDFFRGLYETALGADEVLVRVDYPRTQAGSRYAFEEIARRRGDFAVAGLAGAARSEGGGVRETRLAFFGVADRPCLVTGAGAGELREKMEQIEVSGTSVYPAPYRRQLMRVLFERVMGALEK